MANAFRIKVTKSRTGLYLSAFLMTVALGGSIVAFQLWATASNPQLLAAAVASSAVFGLLGCGLLVYWIVHWAGWPKARALGAAPITAQGLVFVALILLVACAALYSGNNLVYLVLSAMLAATLTSELVSRLDLAGLQLSLGLPDHIFAGRPALARIGLINLKSLIPSFAIRVRVSNQEDGFELQSVYFPMVAAKEKVAGSAEIICKRRGRYKGAGVDLATRFPFGLVERRAKLELKDRIIAYPSVEMTPEAEEALSSLTNSTMSRAAGDSQDLYRVRPATANDGARFIHWKASAGAAELWVREFTREERLSVRLVLDRRVSPDDEAPERFERSVAACAAAAWKLAESGADVTLVTDERSITSRAGERIYELLGYLALVGAVGHGGPNPPTGNDHRAEYLFSSQTKDRVPIARI